MLVWEAYRQVCRVAALCGTHEEYRTPTINDNLNPIWETDNRFTFQAGGSDSTLELEVFNANKVFSNQSLGFLKVDFRSLQPQVGNVWGSEMGLRLAIGSFTSVIRAAPLLVANLFRHHRELRPPRSPHGAMVGRSRLTAHCTDSRRNVVLREPCGLTGGNRKTIRGAKGSMYGEESQASNLSAAPRTLLRDMLARARARCGVSVAWPTPRPRRGAPLGDLCRSRHERRRMDDGCRRGGYARIRLRSGC